MVTWRSATIQDCQQQNCEEIVPQTFNDMAPTLKLYCLCCLHEDGCFMLVVIIAMNGIMVILWVSQQILGWK